MVEFERFFRVTSSSKRAPAGNGAGCRRLFQQYRPKADISPEETVRPPSPNVFQFIRPDALRQLKRHLAVR
jgi:hypothetical protein